MGRSRYKFTENQTPYFLTATTVNWLPLFGQPEIAQIVMNSLQFLQEQNRITLYAWVMLETHLHLIASAKNLSKEIGNFRSYTARQVIDRLKAQHQLRILKQLKFYKLKHKTNRTYQLWQEGSHPQLIQNEAMMRQKIEYIHYNPVKRGYVDEPADWRYSSARNYAGRAGLIDVTMVW